MLTRFAVVFLVAVTSATAQELGTLLVEVRMGTEAVAGAEVVLPGATQLTDASGVARFQIPAGATKITVLHTGFIPITVPAVVTAGADQRLRVELQRELAYK